MRIRKVEKRFRHFNVWSNQNSSRSRWHVYVKGHGSRGAYGSLSGLHGSIPFRAWSWIWPIAFEWGEGRKRDEAYRKRMGLQ